MSAQEEPSYPSPEWAADLIHTLGEASNAFRSSHDLQHQREVLRAFILSLTDLLRDFPIPEEHLCTLQALGTSLFDLCNGVKSPLFIVEKKQERPTSGAELRMVRARAVLYVRLLKQHGVKAKDAETEVAQMLKKAGQVGWNGGPMNRSLIHQWDQNANSSVRPDEHELVQYLIKKFRSIREDTLVNVRSSLSSDPVIQKKVVKPL